MSLKLNLWSTFRTNVAFFSLIKRFNLHGQQSCEFLRTNESVYYITPKGLVWDTNLAFMTSCGNTLLKDLKIVSYSQTPSVILNDFLMYSYSHFINFFVLCNL